MPWNETCAVRNRIRSIGKPERGESGTAAVSGSYGISRKPGYKWVPRFGLGLASHPSRVTGQRSRVRSQMT